MHSNKKRMDTERIAISSKHKVGLIVVASLKFFIAASAVGCAIASIILTTDYYRCVDNNPYYYYRNQLHFQYSVTAQGIWTGCMVFISASLNIRFAVKPTKQTGSFSAGFSLFSFLLTMAMITLESIAISEYYYYYDYCSSYHSYMTWALHCGLLAAACCLFVLTMTNMIISYVATGCYGCCCYSKPRSVTPVSDHDISGFNRPQTVTSQVPFTTERSFVGSRMDRAPVTNYISSRPNRPPTAAQMPYGTERSFVATQMHNAAGINPHHVAMMAQPGMTHAVSDQGQGQNFRANSMVSNAHQNAPPQQNIAGTMSASVQIEQSDEPVTSISNKPPTNATGHVYQDDGISSSAAPQQGAYYPALPGGQMNHNVGPVVNSTQANS